MRMTAAVRAAARAPLLQVIKSAVATIGAWLLAAVLVQGPPPVFAAIAALLVVQPSVNQSFAKAIERSVGVIVGVLIASLLGLAFGEATWVVLVAIALAFLVAWALRMTTGTTNQVAISALLVLALGATSPGYAVDRILETLIGAAVGIIVNLALVPPVALAPAREAVSALSEEVAASMERLAHALERPQSRAGLTELMIQARLLRPMVAAAETAIATATESLTFNPRGRRHRDSLALLHDSLLRLAPIVTQVIGMTRASFDRHEPDLADEPTVRAIAEQLRRAAHDVRRQASHASVQPDRSETVPALTSPLVVRTPSASHWILIGSLLEDLRRIHEELDEP